MCHFVIDDLKTSKTRK